MDRWQQVSQLYHAALERTAGERAGFLREACAGDARLRQEVELLLAQGETAERLRRFVRWTLRRRSWGTIPAGARP